MLRLSMLFLLAACSIQVLADSQVTVPWAEFKTLYSQSIESDLRQRYRQTEPDALVSITEAHYKLALSAAAVSGQIALRGQILRGRPEPILLFGHDLAITEIDEIKGGALLRDSEGYKLFVQGQEPFVLRCSVVLPVQEDQLSRFASFAVPSAVKNRLELSLSESVKLLSNPGFAVSGGQYYFTPGEHLMLRFAERGAEAETAAPSVDILTRIAVRGDKYRLTSYFAPTEALRSALNINFRGARFAGTSLKSSWVKAKTDSLLVTLPSDWRQVFSVDFELPATGKAEISLPYIVDNQGREGQFEIVQTLAAEIAASGAGLRRSIPNESLAQDLKRYTSGSVRHNFIGAGNSLALELQRLSTVEQPDVVLDTVYQFVNVSENGSALAVLRLNLPAQPSAKFRMKPVAGAEVWSLSVNGEPRSLYRHADGGWVIPLTPNESSAVELTYLLKGERLGLKGRLDIILPALGLAANRFNVAIGLGERVDLIAMEGELEPAAGDNWPRVKGFAGKSYFFSKPFYNGAEQTVSVYYKEPLEQGEQP